VEVKSKMVHVTDKRWINKGGDIQVGYGLDGYLAENLYGIPAFLKKGWDCVGIISGRGKVRSGKSTIGAQIGYYIAWLLAGGEMDLRRNDKNIFINPVVTKKPTSKLKFSLKNYVFSPEELMKTARSIPRNSVIIYDEGRSGLDSKGSMTALNRALEDFFQECGQYGHVILVVLPNFFKLHEDYATSRSIFLIDVYHDESWNRGYFNFYNDRQKEKLYYFGKKRIGTTAKYLATKESFRGRFSAWFPFDTNKYEALKKLALQKKELGSRRTRIKEQRDALITIYKKETKKTGEEIAEEMSKALRVHVGAKVIEHGVEDYREYLEKKESLDSAEKKGDKIYESEEE